MPRKSYKPTPTANNRRTIRLVHVGCSCELCARVNAHVVVHEYELHGGSSGTAVYVRSLAGTPAK